MDTSGSTDVETLLNNMRQSPPRTQPLKEPYYDWERVHSERSLMPRETRPHHFKHTPRGDARARVSDTRSSTLPTTGGIYEPTCAKHKYAAPDARNTPNEARNTPGTASSLSLLTSTLESPPVLRNSQNERNYNYNYNNNNNNNYNGPRFLITIIMYFI